MELSQVLMRRAAWISLCCLAFALILAVLRAQADMRNESRGAERIADLMGHLSAFQSAEGSAQGKELEALRSIAADERLRHIRFRLSDGEGRILVDSAREEGVSIWTLPAAWLPAASTQAAKNWQLKRSDGQAYTVSLIGNPASESQEAGANILGMALILLCYCVTLLFGLYWAVRHSLAPIRNILDAIHTWEHQDFARRLPAMPLRELEVLGGALNRLAGALDHSQQERRKLALQVQTLQEDERARLARELHDDFAQSVTAMRADSSWLARKLEKEPELAAVADDLGKRCADLHGHMRGVLRQLRPLNGGAADEAVSLVQMLGNLVQDWQNLPGQTIRASCAVELDDEGRSLHRQLCLSLFRLTQEALTNASRHAGSCQLSVRVRQMEPEGIEWSVKDDGPGIPDLDMALKRGNGLAGMRERVWAHGGDIEFITEGRLEIRARFEMTMAGAET